MILDKILEKKRAEVAERKGARSFADLRREAEGRNDFRPFRLSLRGEGVSLIAEIKRASPSAGLIREDFDVARIAAGYERGGASAISVLTDEHFFRGDIGFLAEARRASSLPLLRKDFLIDEYQIAEAGAAGADGFLLIAAALSREQIADYIAFGGELGMDALVEVHDGRELDRVLAAGAGLIGVNNRNLRTFEVDLSVSLDLVRAIPTEAVRVSESGIGGPDDRELLGRAGFDAVLVGESLMRADSPEEAARLLLGGE